MRRRLATVALAAALLAPTAGVAFVRSTTPSGTCLWWGARTITFVQNFSALAGPGCATGAEAAGLVRASFASWAHARREGASQPCTDLTFADGGASDLTETGFHLDAGAANVNLVVYRAGSCFDTQVVPAAHACHGTPGACATLFNCWDHDASTSSAGAIAITTTTFNVHTGEIVDADVELFGWNGDPAAPPEGTLGSYFTCAGPDRPSCPSPPYAQLACVWMDVGNTVTHEAGHLLGLAHVCASGSVPDSGACPSPPSVMEPTATTGETSKRVLAPDDVDAVCTLYPAGGATLTRCAPAVAPPSQTPSGCGCSLSEGGVSTALLVAALLAWSRRRRP